MTERADEDLLQRALDGAMGDAEAERLRSRLASDPTLRARAEQLRRLADLLEDQEAVEPPPELVDRVMAAAATGDRATATRRRRKLTHQLFGLFLHHSGQDGYGSESPWMTGWTGGGAIVAKKALWAVAGLAVIVILAVVYYNGTRSVSGGAEGTIGAADRYRGAQPTSKDVVAPQAAAQQFLQSDVFDRIVKDKNLRNIFTDRNLCAMLAQVPEEALQESDAWLNLGKIQTALADNPEMLAVLRSARARAAVAEMENLQALSRAAARAALADSALMENLRKAQAALGDASDEEWAAALTSKQLTEALSPSAMEALRAVRNNLKFKAAVAEDQQAFLKVALGRSFRSALGDDAFLSLLKTKNALAQLDDPNVAALLRSNRNFMKLFDDPNFTAAIQNRQFMVALAESESLRVAFKARGFQESLNRFDALQEALRAREQ